MDREGEALHMVNDPADRLWVLYFSCGCLVLSPRGLAS